jgi:hypothetical protein
MRRISQQSPQNGKNAHLIVPEGEKCRKIANYGPENAENSLKTAVFRVWRGRESEKSGFWPFRTRCGSLPKRKL